MSDFEDPSANTGRFRAFVERGDEDVAPSRRLPASPAVLVVVGVVIVALFLAVWVAALAYWRFGQVEARWTIPMRDGHLVSETLEE